MKKTIITIAIIAISFPALAVENLDELEARASRKNINTFYSGESGPNGYLWQPQTIQYYDTTYGTEIWIYTQTDDTD